MPSPARQLGAGIGKSKRELAACRSVGASSPAVGVTTALGSGWNEPPGHSVPALRHRTDILPSSMPALCQLLMDDLTPAGRSA